MVYKSGKLRNLKIMGGGNTNCEWGICNNVNIVKLLQPNRICTNIWNNKIKYELNVQRHVYARKDSFIFLCDKEF